jgi:hypothetical protein
MTIKFKTLKCLKNGCEWISRMEKLPSRCGVCGYPRWWEQKQEKIKNISCIINEKKCTYEIVKTLDVGQQVTLPWINKERERDFRANQNRVLGIKKYAFHHKKQFYCEGGFGGLIVQRIK